MPLVFPCLLRAAGRSCLQRYGSPSLLIRFHFSWLWQTSRSSSCPSSRSIAYVVIISYLFLAVGFAHCLPPISTLRPAGEGACRCICEPYQRLQNPLLLECTLRRSLSGSTTHSHFDFWDTRILSCPSGAGRILFCMLVAVASCILWSRRAARSHS